MRGVRQSAPEKSDGFLSTLCQPSAAYDRPSDVLGDADLTLYEKRSILASWASDFWAMDSQPSLRAPEGLSHPATIDEIMACLRKLDDELHGRCTRVRRDGKL
jgi:hypothetical protein